MKKLFFILILLLPNVSHAALTTNLVSYWKLDESSGTRVDSPGANDLTDNNTVAAAAGIINNGADFEKDTSEYLNITDASQTGLEGGASWSISFWAKFESDFAANGETRTIVNKTGGSDGTRGYTLSFRRVDAFGGDVIQFTTSTDGTNANNNNYFVAAAIAIGTLEHWVITINTTGTTITVYRDNSLVGSTAINGAAFDNTGDFSIGAGYDAGSFNSYFDGILDEVGIWSRIITTDEMAELYNSGAGLQYPFTGTAALTTPILALVRSFWIF